MRGPANVLCSILRRSLTYLTRSSTISPFKNINPLAVQCACYKTTTQTTATDAVSLCLLCAYCLFRGYGYLSKVLGFYLSLEFSLIKGVFLWRVKLSFCF